MTELWALIAVIVATTNQGKRNAESDQAQRENETNRRVADAQEANRRDDISERRKRMFGDSDGEFHKFRFDWYLDSRRA